MPIKATFDAWLDAEHVSPEAFGELIEEWRDAPDNPMHQLETGAITGDTFATAWSRRLRRIDGAAVPAGRPASTGSSPA